MNNMEKKMASLENFSRLGYGAEFIYLKPDGSLSVRTVLPQKIEVSAKGDPSVVCYDLARRALRKYRIDRIQGEIIIHQKPPEGYDSEQFAIEEVKLNG